MEIETLEKIDTIEKAIKNKTLILEIENVVNNKRKKVTYNVFCENYYNKFFDYLFYVNGDFFEDGISFNIEDILLNKINK